MDANTINYGAFQGIHSFGAAILFAVLYALLFVFYAHRAFRHTSFVYIFLVVFCAIRTTGFAIRADIAKSSQAAHDIGLSIGYGVLSACGFFGLLYSAYTLVLDRELLLGPDVQRGWLTKTLQNRRGVRLFLTVAVALGVAGSDMSFYPSTASAGRALREAGVILFLAVMVALLVQTFMLVVAHISARDALPTDGRVGDRHGILFLLAIVLLLLEREVFSTATLWVTRAAVNEKLWYPLVALPELLAVLLFAVPGLVPSRRRLRDAQATDEEDKA